MKPLISIIVPVYNVENYLVKCLESILSQTYHNLEVILVDDGSPDRCPQICDEYARKDPRICVIHQKNQGVSSARNAGLERATGDYIGFVDGDDFISPVMYENLLKLIEQYRVQIAMCHFGRVVSNQFPDNRNSQSGILPIKEAISKILIPGCFDNGSLCNKLFDYKLFNGHQPVRLEPKITVGEDLLALIQCLLKVKSVAYTTQPYYQYRINFSSVTHRFSPKSLTYLTAWNKVISMLPFELSNIAKAVYSYVVSGFLCSAYASKSKELIPYLKTERKRYLSEFKHQQKAFSRKDRIRVWGTGLLAPVFCRAWNMIKFIRAFLLRLKMISTKIV